jgi:predicted membrane GTPase involved in stress response
MSEKQKENKVQNEWQLSAGFYPGILFGVRSYINDLEIENKETKEITNYKQTTHVLYIPFMDISLEIYKQI